MRDSEKATVRRNTKKSSGNKRKGILNRVNTSISERINWKKLHYVDFLILWRQRYIPTFLPKNTIKCNTNTVYIHNITMSITS